MSNYATVEDVATISGRNLTQTEQERVNTLLPLASSLLREEAKKVGKNLDSMIESDADLGNIAKVVTVASILRILNASNSAGPAMSQFSQSAMGYTVSGTFVNPGEDLYFLANELKRLGLKRQRYGVMDIYGTD